MPEINERQAMVPEGATVLPNPRGTAPGLWLEAEGHIVILLPGVPAELRAIVRSGSEAAPRAARRHRALFSRDLRIIGLPESEVEQRVSPALRAVSRNRNHDSRRAHRNSAASAHLVARRGQAGKAARRNRRAAWRSLSANISIPRTAKRSKTSSRAL